jgi:hypothetical protein
MWSGHCRGSCCTQSVSRLAPTYCTAHHLDTTCCLVLLQAAAAEAAAAERERRKQLLQKKKGKTKSEKEKAAADKAAAEAAEAARRKVEAEERRQQHEEERQRRQEQLELIRKQVCATSGVECMLAFSLPTNLSGALGSMLGSHSSLIPTMVGSFLPCWWPSWGVYVDP